MNSVPARIGRGLTLSCRAAAVLLLGVLAACSGRDAQQLPAQKWQGMDVRIESRASPLNTDTSEILVMVTDDRSRPVYNLVVSLRTSDKDAWVQAIEDGQVGVYRRAVKIEPGAELQVQIRRNDTVGVLRFSLKPQP